MNDTLTPHGADASNLGTVGVLALHVLGGFERPSPNGLVSFQSVVDQLLDLRNVVDVGGRAVVDHLITSIPGVNVVDSNWWLDQIDALEDLFATWDDHVS